MLQILNSLGLSYKDRNVISLFFGFLLSLVFPPLNIFPFLFISFTILYLLVSSAKNARDAFVLGWWFGCTFFVCNFYCLSHSLSDITSNVFLIPLIILLLSFLFAFYIAIACMIFFLIRGNNAIVNVCHFSFLILFSEWVRANSFIVLPWNFIAYSWSISNTVMQFASLFGVYGLSFVTIFCAMSPASYAVDKNYSIAPFCMSIVMLLCMFLYGLFRIDVNSYIDGVTLRLVDKNIVNKDVSDDLINGKFTHVIYAGFNETVVHYRSFKDRHLIFGGIRINEKTTQALQSMFVVSPQGEALTYYDKRRYIPFLEDFPNFLSNLYAFFSDTKLDRFVKGKSGVRTIILDNTPPFSPLISYEIILPNQVADNFVKPYWILNLINKPISSKLLYDQLLIASRFRAIEEGMPIVRVGDISGVIDPYGIIQQNYNLNNLGFVDVELPSRLDFTLYKILYYYIDIIIIALAALYFTVVINK